MVHVIVNVESISMVYAKCIYMQRLHYTAKRRTKFKCEIFVCPSNIKSSNLVALFLQKCVVWMGGVAILHPIVLTMENLIKSLDLQYQKYYCGVLWIMYKRAATGANFSVYFSVYWTPKFLWPPDIAFKVSVWLAIFYMNSRLTKKFLMIFRLTQSYLFNAVTGFFLTIIFCNFI